MAFKNRQKLNRSVIGTLPKIHGDKYRPSDKLIDDAYIRGKLGDLIEMLVSSPSILSGLVVTDAGAGTINISSGQVIIKDNVTSVVYPHNYDGSIMDAQTIDPFFVMVSFAGASGIAVAGSGTKYVKLVLYDAAVLERGYSSDPGTEYPFIVAESVSVVVDTTAPTANEVLLATIAESASPFTIVTTSRVQDTAAIFPNNKIKFDDNILSLFQSFSADRTYTLQDKDMIVAGIDDIQRVDVYANIDIIQYKIVHANGKSPLTAIVAVSPVASTSHTPIGIAETAITSGVAGRVLRYGSLQVTGFTGTVIGNKVYTDVNGNLTAADTGIPVGYTMTTGSNAWVFFDFGGGGGGGGSGTGAALEVDVSQTSHGFAPGNSIARLGSSWVKAIATDSALSGRAIVSAVSDIHNFKFIPYGRVALSETEWDAVTGGSGGLVPSTVYSTSESVPGGLTTGTPAIHNPMIVAISDTTALVQPGFIASESGAGNTIVTAEAVATGLPNQEIEIGHTLQGKSFVFVWMGGAILSETDYSINGTKITILKAWQLGLVIHIRAIIATIFTNDINQFMVRKTVGLQNEESINLNDIFPNPSNCLIEVWDQSNPLINGKFAYQVNTPNNASIISGSSLFVPVDSPDSLCLIGSLDNVFLKNRLGVAKTFVVWRYI